MGTKTHTTTSASQNENRTREHKKRAHTKKKKHYIEKVEKRERPQEGYFNEKKSNTLYDPESFCEIRLKFGASLRGFLSFRRRFWFSVGFLEFFFLVFFNFGFGLCAIWENAFKCKDNVNVNLQTTLDQSKL